MAVRDRNPRQVRGPAPERTDRLEHVPPVRVPERVHEHELAAALREERVDAPALPPAERVQARCELLYAATRLHGAKPFSTPRSAGSSAG